MAIHVGQRARVTAGITALNDAGKYALIDPVALTVDVTDPSGATTTLVYGTDPDVARLGRGRYIITFDVTSAGRWTTDWHTETFHQSYSFIAGP